MKPCVVLASVRQRGEEISGEIIAYRRTLHKIPELRMDTPFTEEFIVRALRDIGIEDVHRGVGGHGVCAVIYGDTPGMCLAIRADCDGLPIKEETGLPFASTNGNMHACGHDAHVAMALGAAKLIYENRRNLRGCVKLIFQPYEEGDGGAKLMLADGVLENPRVDAIIALHNHPTEVDGCVVGDVLVTSEPVSANIYAYEAVFKGETRHVCLSDDGKNPVHMACLAVAEIAKNQKAGVVNAVTVIRGGVRNNIIPDTCMISGSIRSFDRWEHEQMKQRVIDLIKASAQAFSGSVEIKTCIDLMATEIDEKLYKRFLEVVSEVYPERGAIVLEERDLIGEDFARYADVVPGMYFKLYTKPAGAAFPLHHPKFDLDERALAKGSVVFAAFALEWLNKGE